MAATAKKPPGGAKKIGGFPWYVWAGGLVAAVLVGLYFKQRASAAGTSGSSASSPTDPAVGAGGGADVTPFEDLANSINSLVGVVGAGVGSTTTTPDQVGSSIDFLSAEIDSLIATVGAGFTSLNTAPATLDTAPSITTPTGDNSTAAPAGGGAVAPIGWPESPVYTGAPVIGPEGPATPGFGGGATTFGDPDRPAYDYTPPGADVPIVVQPITYASIGATPEPINFAGDVAPNITAAENLQAPMIQPDLPAAAVAPDWTPAPTFVPAASPDWGPVVTDTVGNVPKSVLKQVQGEAFGGVVSTKTLKNGAVLTTYASGRQTEQAPGKSAYVVHK